MPLKVRAATLADASGIAAVHLASWHGAYRDDAPPGWLAAQTLGGRTDVWRARLAGVDTASDSQESTDVVIAQDGAIIGFCGLAMPSRDRDAVPGTAEIPAFYIDPGHWRIGAGRALMTAALAQCADAGYERVTLWVLQTNARAQAFYATFGFADDGGRLIQTDWPTQIRMARGVCG